MAVSMRTVGRSILESMLFLAVLGSSFGIVNVLPIFPMDKDINMYLSIPILTAIASAVVAVAFPKPTFKWAFVKYFLGGLLTYGIFALMSIALGPVVFTIVLDWLWDTGAAVWDISSASGILAAIFAVIIYIMLTVIIVGMIFAGLFALTNFVVLLLINVVSDRHQGSASTSGDIPPPAA